MEQENEIQKKLAEARKIAEENLKNSVVSRKETDDKDKADQESRAFVEDKIRNKIKRKLQERHKFYWLSSTACFALSGACTLLENVPIINLVALPFTTPIKHAFNFLGYFLWGAAVKNDPTISPKEHAIIDKSVKDNFDFSAKMGMLGAAGLLIGMLTPAAPAVAIGALAFGATCVVASMAGWAYGTYKEYIKERDKPVKPGDNSRKYRMAGHALNVSYSAGCTVASLFTGIALVSSVVFPPLMLVAAGVATVAGIVSITSAVASKISFWWADRKAKAQEATMAATAKTPTESTVDQEVDLRLKQGPDMSKAVSPVEPVESRELKTRLESVQSSSAETPKGIENPGDRATVENRGAADAITQLYDKKRKTAELPSHPTSPASSPDPIPASPTPTITSPPPKPR